jgi:hypothetical protein
LEIELYEKLKQVSMLLLDPAGFEWGGGMCASRKKQGCVQAAYLIKNAKTEKASTSVEKLITTWTAGKEQRLMWPFDNNNQQVYQQYAQAYDTGYYNNVDPNQAAYHMQQFVQNAPQDLQQRLFEQHFSQMPFEQLAALAQHMPRHYNADPNDPRSMAQGFMRLGQENPNMLQRIFSHPLLLGGMIGLTGLVAKHMIDNRQQHQQQYGQNYDQNYTRGGYNQGGYNQGGVQQELNHEQGEIRELRRELKDERRREEYIEEEERPRHHRREEY